MLLLFLLIFVSVHAEVKEGAQAVITHFDYMLKNKHYISASRMASLPPFKQLILQTTRPFFKVLQANDEVTLTQLFEEFPSLSWIRNLQGDTLLHFALKAQKLELAKKIIDHDHTLIALHNLQGQTPLHVAAAQHAALEIIEFLIEQGADVNARDVEGSTPLYYAAREGHIDTMKLLIDQGARVNHKNNYFSTPIHVAVDAQQLEAAQCLLDHKANALIADYEGMTPLHTAVYYGAVELIQLLKNAGIHELTNHHGETPATLARALANKNVLECFES